MSASQHLYKCLRMPSGKLLSIRRIKDGFMPEVVVKEVDEDGQMSCFEYIVRLDFVLKYGREVRLLSDSGAKQKKAVAA